MLHVIVIGFFFLFLLLLFWVLVESMFLRGRAFQRLPRVHLSLSLSLSHTSYELTRTWGVIHEALVFLVFELGLSVRVFRNGDEVGLACHGGTRGAA